jgi:hypothetical protein
MLYNDANKQFSNFFFKGNEHTHPIKINKYFWILFSKNYNFNKNFILWNYLSA